MAARATSQSYDTQVSGSSKLAGYNMGKVRCATFVYTNDVAGTITDAPMGLLPAGKIRVLQASSVLSISENASDESMVDGGTISIGYGGYTEPDGTVITKDADYWVAVFNPAAAHEKRFALPAGGGAAGVGEPKVFNSKSGLPVTMDIATQNLKAGAVITLQICFVQG